LVAATVSEVVGGVRVIGAPDMPEDDAGAMDSEDGAIAPEAGALDEVLPDADMAPELAGALAEALEPESDADIAPSVEAAGAVSEAGFWQAAIDRAAAPAARMISLFMAFSRDEIAWAGAARRCRFARSSRGVNELEWTAFRQIRSSGSRSGPTRSERRPGLLPFR
jgi:hypothetical protein